MATPTEMYNKYYKHKQRGDTKIKMYKVFGRLGQYNAVFQDSHNQEIPISNDESGQNMKHQEVFNR